MVDIIFNVIRRLAPAEINLIVKLNFLFTTIISVSSSYFFFSFLINMYNKMLNIIKIGIPIIICALILVKNVWV